MKKTILTILLCVLTTSHVMADGWFAKFMESFSEMDTTYIEPQKYDWTVMAQNSNSFDRVEVDYSDGKFVFAPDIAFKVGPYVGYKFVTLGYTVDVKSLFKSSGRTDVTMAFYMNQLGIDLFYRKANDFKIRRARFDDVSELRRLEGMSSGALSTKNFGVDLYYVLNHKRYSMPAVFAQSTVQRKSAGSFTLGLGYMHSSIDLDITNIIFDLIISMLDFDDLSEEESTITDETITDTEVTSDETSTDEDFDSDLDDIKLARNMRYKSLSAQLGYGYNWVFARNWALGAHVAANPSVKWCKGDLIGVLSDEVSDTYKKTTANIDLTARVGVVFNNMRWYAGANAVLYNQNFDVSDYDARNTFGALNIYVGYNFGQKAKKKSQQ